VRTAAQRALYNNLDRDEGLALAVDAAIQSARMDGWRDNAMKTKKVRLAINAALKSGTAATPDEANQLRQGLAHDAYDAEALTQRLLDLAKHQNDY
jgi:type I restriction enzyme R subunit